MFLTILMVRYTTSGGVFAPLRNQLSSCVHLVMAFFDLAGVHLSVHIKLCVPPHHRYIPEPSLLGGSVVFSGAIIL